MFDLRNNIYTQGAIILNKADEVGNETFAYLHLKPANEKKSKKISKEEVRFAISVSTVTDQGVLYTETCTMAALVDAIKEDTINIYPVDSVSRLWFLNYLKTTQKRLRQFSASSRFLKIEGTTPNLRFFGVMVNVVRLENNESTNMGTALVTKHGFC